MSKKELIDNYAILYNEKLILKLLLNYNLQNKNKKLQNQLIKFNTSFEQESYAEFIKEFDNLTKCVKKTKYKNNLLDQLHISLRIYKDYHTTKNTLIQNGINIKKLNSNINEFNNKVATQYLF